MSWDVLIVEAEDTPDDLNTVPSGWKPKPMGKASDIRAQINASFPEVKWSVPDWGTYQHKNLSIEFNFQAAGVVESFALHIRGDGDPIPIIERLCKDNGWAAIDYYDSRKIDFKADPQSHWKRFTKYRDHAFDKLEDGST